jgi:pimeloyl-ACP methyl ester carboxylesterase
MNVREHGPANRPSILFLHGAGISGWSWNAATRFLEDFHCLVPDLPEHGNSLESGSFSMQECAAELARIIRERAHGGRAHVTGLSLGGQLALQLLATQRDIVERVFITGTNILGIPGWRFLAPTLRAFMPMTRWDWLMRIQARALSIPTENWAEFRADTRTVTAESLNRLVSASSDFRLPPGLAAASNPTLVAVGEREPSVIHRSAEALVAALATATGIVVPKMHHNWPIAAPELFANTLRAWIESTQLPARLVALCRARG